MSDQERLDQAIKYAVDCHAGQRRKGSGRPYILHPLEVMTILNGMGADTDLLIAGLLHDTIEDTGATREDIRSRFGENVARLVTAHTEDKSRSWQERKSAAIEEVRQADRRLALLIMADKLSNLRSMERDFDAVGEKLWEYFHAPKDRQAWYYTEITGALKPFENDPHAGACYEEIKSICSRLF